MRRCIYFYDSKAVIDREDGSSILYRNTRDTHAVEIMRERHPETHDWRVISLDTSYHRDKMKLPL